MSSTKLPDDRRTRQVLQDAVAHELNLHDNVVRDTDTMPTAVALSDYRSVERSEVHRPVTRLQVAHAYCCVTLLAAIVVAAVLLTWALSK